MSKNNPSYPPKGEKGRCEMPGSCVKEIEVLYLRHTVFCVFYEMLSWKIFPILHVSGNNITVIKSNCNSVFYFAITVTQLWVVNKIGKKTTMGVWSYYSLTSFIFHKFGLIRFITHLILKFRYNLNLCITQYIFLYSFIYLLNTCFIPCPSGQGIKHWH